MLNYTNVTIRTDRDVKAEGELILQELGLNMTTAMNAFLRAVVRQRKIPFELALYEEDPFYGEENQKMLRRSREQVESGNIIYKTSCELGLDDV